MAAYLVSKNREENDLEFHTGEKMNRKFMFFLLCDKVELLELDGHEMERAKKIVQLAGLKWFDDAFGLKRIYANSDSTRALIAIILSEWDNPNI